MASGIYSRYIPPKKKPYIVPVSDSALESPFAPSTLSSGSLRITNTSTKPNTSATYTRYIPPTSKITSDLKKTNDLAGTIEVNISPKRKRESHDDPVGKKERTKKSTRLYAKLGPNATPSQTQPGVAHDARKGTESLPERKKKRKDESNKETEDLKIEDVENKRVDHAGHAEEHTRHKTMLLKKDKSLRKAEKLAIKKERKATRNAESGTEDSILQVETPELHALEPIPQPEPNLDIFGKPTFSVLPPWLEFPIRVSPDATASFTELSLEEEVIEALQSKGFEHAFAVQAAVLPLLLPGDRHQRGDVLVSAATGSGKTLAYVLPMLQDISRSTVTQLRGLIVMPTRELVNQAREVCEVCATAFASSGRKRIRIGVAVGNQTFKTEQTSLVLEDQAYNPEEYRRREKRANAKWEPAFQEFDEDYLSFDAEKTISTLPDHIIEYRSKVDILICTPGRLVEHVKSTLGFTLEFVKWLVIDEADKLLDQSFQQWLEIVMARLSPERKSSRFQRRKRKEEIVTKVILSATVTRDIGQLSALKLHRPKLVVLEGNEQATNEVKEMQSDVIFNLPSSLKESAVKIMDDGEKPLYLVHLLGVNEMLDKTAEKLDDDSSDDSSSNSGDYSSSDDSVSSASSSSLEASQGRVQPKSLLPPADASRTPRGVLIFTRSNENAVRLSRLLTLLDPAFSDITGTLTSTIRNPIRKRTLKGFRRGTLSIIIASDLVARGLDIPNLAHVINYDIPTSLTSYIHRVGRTARAGRKGHAWTLISNTEARWFWNEIARSPLLQRAVGAKIERVSVDAALFGEERRRKYDEALTVLGQEAHGPSSKVK